MTDLTEAAQTIISILGNSSTGVGTGNYTITDDNASGLTIADGEILVTASLSKEEIKDQFGGTQDYDVIIVVHSEEVEDDWIGFSTKQWKENVIIEVNVIDKWSAVAIKYITGDLVRYKAVNAIRKFIKANTSSPGGTINNWELTRVVNEEDKTTRPITYKAIITTEALMYYNPTSGSGTGSGTGYADTDTTLFLLSKEKCGRNTNLGTITEDGNLRALPASLVKTNTDEFTILYTKENNGYRFSSWSVEGDISVDSSTANPTTLTINGDGTLTAIYEEVRFMIGGSGIIQADRAQMYYPIFGSLGGGEGTAYGFETLGESQCVIPYSCIMKNLYISVDDSPNDLGASEIVLILFKNGVETDLTVTITGGDTSGFNTSDEIEFSAGDTISIFFVIYKVSWVETQGRWGFEEEKI